MRVAQDKRGPATICYKCLMAARKYGQKGYMEDEPRERGRARRSRPQRHGPGGRGLGAPTATVFKCARCGGRLDPAETAGDAVCDGCGEAVHSCVNCRFFDTGAPNECRAGVEERIAAKSGRNECASYEPKLVRDHDADGGSPDDPKAAFDALFDF